MEIVPFTDQYAMAAELYGVDEEELRRRDEAPPSRRRWLATRNGKPVGAATTWLRPDQRRFVAFECRELSAYGPLTETVGAVIAQPLYTVVNEDDRPALVALRAAGFRSDFVEERFRLRFDAALEHFGGAPIPGGFSIEPADAVDEGRLFTLDNAIRNDMPGTDGWRGDRDWFHEELTTSLSSMVSRVAVDTHNGEYVGMATIRRDPPEPRFELIGVLRQYRGTPIARALARHALDTASRWGHDTFTVTTVPTNAAISPLLDALGAARIGRIIRLIRVPS